MNNFLLVLFGVILLSAGGEALIRGALSISRRLGVSPLLSGLVIVGFGTSAPELVVSVDAALNQQPDLAVGNVVGSNIGNILLILGLCAFITPLTVKPLALRRDAGMVVLASVLFVLMAGIGELATVQGLVLIIILLLYLVWAYNSERSQALPSADLHKEEALAITALPNSVPGTALMVVAGIVLLIVGAGILLTGAVQIAQSFAVSEAVIGLTLVAVGTSLPELSISVIAALRRQADVAVGNILGSNIFNLLGILGVSALLQPLAVHSRIVQFDQWLMLGSAILHLLLLYTGRSLSRLEGGLLLLGYGGYLALSFTIYGG